ncbi:hypothetical protein ABTY59_08060 [Streptomyces sp. NPDC096079]|uniref:hypothetical protein n=1 Tax=unclassified Streptomyces TaxID=2593676 RepID=UPI00331D74E3
MVAGRRREECDSCGAPYGTWVASLRMTLCAECERAGAAQPEREPVLVGDVLAGLAALVTRPPEAAADRGGARAAVGDTARAVSAVPQQRTPGAPAREEGPAAWDTRGADTEWPRTA